MLKERFHLFDVTPPVSRRELQRLEKAYYLFTGSAHPDLDGLDISQTRAVSFGRLGTALAVPGTSGVCLYVVAGASAGWGCDPFPSALKSGIFQFGSSDGTYQVNGLVPNGIHAVTVRLGSGKTAHLNVNDNVVLEDFASEPISVTFESASGNTETVRAF